MDFLKELFGANGSTALNWEQFSKAVTSKGFKIADLATGNYVSKQKYTDDLQAKDTQISTLNDTLNTRDTDLASIKKQLENAGMDKEKLTALSDNLSTLQTKYDNDVKAYQEQLSRQAYEFAVKEFAGTKKFTSNAAKRDFINSMIGKNLTMENDKIMGAEDFVTSYSADNADAFVNEETVPTSPLPQFVQTTPGVAKTQDSGFHFNFTGVRPKPDETK